MTTSTITEKARLRRHFMELRAKAAMELPPAEAGERAGARVLDLLPEDVGTKVVSAFWPIGSEIDPRPLMYWLVSQGALVGLPVVQGKNRPLLFRRWTESTPMVRATLGIPVPDPAEPEIEPDVFIVPLLAFDADGYRLGYGGGFYDRTLAAARATARTTGRTVTAIGLAYAAQRSNCLLPREPTDIGLDRVVTEADAFAFPA